MDAYIAFHELHSDRWETAVAEFFPALEDVQIQWRTGEYHHFNSPRGFAVTFIHSPRDFELVYAEKFLYQSKSRKDAIIRHEIGHVLDSAIHPVALDRWAAQRRGLILPQTSERRADAIAYALWGKTILYDKQDVQSLSSGVATRPARLGL